MLPLLLGVGGAVVTTLASVALYLTRRAGRPDPDLEGLDPPGEQCAMPSPDATLFCTAAVGHEGWHHNGDTAWYGDVWAVDQYADTQAGPLLTDDTDMAPTSEAPGADPDPEPEPTPEPEPEPKPVQIPEPPPVNHHDVKRAGTRRAATLVATGGIGFLLLQGLLSITTHESVHNTESSSPSSAAPPATAPPAAAPQGAPTTTDYPKDFTGQDRAFATQVMRRGLMQSPASLAELPGLAHATCNGLKDSAYANIEDPATAWNDAKREQVADLANLGWGRDISQLGQFVDLIVDTYCPNRRPPAATQPSHQSAGDATFTEGWNALAMKYRIVVAPATAVMIKQAHAVCTALATAPEWEVVQDVDAWIAGNNSSYKQEFVALARESYCPIS